MAGGCLMMGGIEEVLKETSKGPMCKGSVCVSVCLSVCLGERATAPTGTASTDRLAYTIHHPPGSPKATKPVFVKLAAGRKFQKTKSGTDMKTGSSWKSEDKQEAAET